MAYNPVKLTLAATLAVTSLFTFAAASNAGLKLTRSDATTNIPIVKAPPRRFKLKFGCVVAGSPVEFPDDIAITNIQGFATPAGLKVAYNAPFGNTGVVTLPALPPGKSFFVSNAIPGGHPAGGNCTAFEK